MKTLIVNVLCFFVFLLGGASMGCAQEIGANFNHEPEIIDLQYLRKSPVEWIRTTPYIFEYINGQKDPATEPLKGDVNGDRPANPLWYDDFTAIVNKGKMTHKATHH